MNSLKVLESISHNSSIDNFLIIALEQLGIKRLEFIQKHQSNNINIMRKLLLFLLLFLL